ncbi:hypothetical protein SFRURICE_014249 [Spodoptera frugiperda]|nr:hypothetical protein SFRURICE_014249 [Spodoptera frugiperda]
MNESSSNVVRRTRFGMARLSSAVVSGAADVRTRRKPQVRRSAASGACAAAAHAATLASGRQSHVTNGQERHSLLIIVRVLRAEIECPRIRSSGMLDG